MDGTSLQLPPAYALERSTGPPKGAPPSVHSSYTEDSMNYSESIMTTEDDGTTSYVAASSVTAGGMMMTHYYNDATKTVHEMHLALLYLLSNPEEFQRALRSHPPRGATTLADWNAEYYDDETNVTNGDDTTTTTTFDGLAYDGSGTTTDNMGGDYSNAAAAAAPPNTPSSSSTQQPSSSTTTTTTPLPFVVFADDAEVVLPQAHTASQLFGIERVEGIELEAAAGVPALSQLFLRWLALMPGGDHLNIIDPPGLTVMRIAGGRYRVTAAHRVVWTWMNEFASLSEAGETNNMQNKNNDNNNNNSKAEEQQEEKKELQMGDLVTMTIVDVFETDNNGKLLSYCPTFDNRAIFKTNQTSETLRKGSAQLMSSINVVAKSRTALKVNKAAAQLTRMSINAAKSVATSVRQQIDERMVHSNNQNPNHLPSDSLNAAEFEQVLNEAEKAVAPGSPARKEQLPSDGESASSTPARKDGKRSENYVSEDETVETR